MQIDLNKEITAHFTRIEGLAEQASKDQDESFSSRASAMTALTAIIKELTKTQAEVINMELILKTEQALIEAAKEIFPSDKYHIFTEKLNELLG